MTKKEEIVEKCLEAYFYLTVNEEKCYLFQDKNGNLHKPHHKENEMYVFLQESLKADRITYVNELYHFCTKIIRYIMETKELKITIPEGYCIDESKSTFEKIVFKKKDTKPRSWEEYCKNFKGQYYYIQDYRDNIATSFTPDGLISAHKNYVPSEELAEAFLAMMQLMSLRQAWIGDWEPNWNGRKFYNCIVILDNKYIVEYFSKYRQVLSFPTKEMAEDFMTTFKDLLEIAKPLI